MTRKLALIPVDARPVTYDLPKDLAMLTDWQLLTPPKPVLGFLKEPADFAELFQWIQAVSPQVEGIIVSMDMILYGGLVPSRVNNDSKSIIEERLSKFFKIKKYYPEVKIMAFSSTMRLSNSYVNQEEKDYWDQYGKEIWSYSYHYHRYLEHQLDEDEIILSSMKAKIPDWILEDYLQTRERNFHINQSLIDYVQQGIIDLLVFPQDDTSEYGLNIIEQKKLQDKVVRLNLHKKIYIYPGADEVASVLTARLIYQLEEETMPTFYPVYSGLKGSLSTAMYEDRPLHESVKGQIYAFGSHTVDGPEDANLILGVNVPGRRQGDLALQLNLHDVDTNDRNIGEWMSRLNHYYKQGKQVAIADVAYANGADIAMTPRLLSTFSIKQLAGYAAWNTAGNTIGTVVAQAALIHLADKKGNDTTKKKESLLLIRLLDDYLYQTIIRQEVRKAVVEENVSTKILLEKVKDLFQEKASYFIEETGFTHTVEDIYLPWNRTFEIGITLKSQKELEVSDL